MATRGGEEFKVAGNRGVRGRRISGIRSRGCKVVEWDIEIANPARSEGVKEKRSWIREVGKIDDHNHDAQEEWKGKRWESWGRSRLHAPPSVTVQPQSAFSASATMFSHFRVLSWRPRSMNTCSQGIQ
jgi:hypothetical protein